MTNTDFASLTLDQQTALQRQTALDILNRAAEGDATVTQSEMDFANRVLGRAPTSVNSGGVSDFWQGVGDDINATVDSLTGAAGKVGTSIMSNELKLLFPLMLVGVLVLVGLYLWKRQ